MLDDCYEIANIKRSPMEDRVGPAVRPLPLNSGAPSPPLLPNPCPMALWAAYLGLSRESHEAHRLLTCPLPSWPLRCRFVPGRSGLFPTRWPSATRPRRLPRRATSGPGWPPSTRADSKVRDLTFLDGEELDDGCLPRPSTSPNDVGRPAFPPRADVERDFVDLHKFVGMEAAAAGVPGVSSLWGGQAGDEMPAPRRLDLETFAAEARLHGAVVFVALHGGVGENGQLQAFLEEQKIPFTGSSSAAAGVAMDKYETAAVLRALEPQGISCAPKHVMTYDKVRRERCGEPLERSDGWGRGGWQRRPLNGIIVFVGSVLRWAPGAPFPLKKIRNWCRSWRRCPTLRAAVTPCSATCSPCSAPSRPPYASSLSRTGAALGWQGSPMGWTCGSTSRPYLRGRVPCRPGPCPPPIPTSSCPRKHARRLAANSMGLWPPPTALFPLALCPTGPVGNSRSRTSYLFEPFISTDPVVLRRDEEGRETIEWSGRSRWVEVTIGVVCQDGGARALTPSLTVKQAGHVLTLEVRGLSRP